MSKNENIFNINKKKEEFNFKEKEIGNNIDKDLNLKLVNNIKEDNEDNNKEEEENEENDEESEKGNENDDEEKEEGNENEEEKQIKYAIKLS